MAEQFGGTQNMNFYDQALLQASKRAEMLTLKVTGGKPNPAIETKITIGLLAQLVSPGIERALRAESDERGATTETTLVGVGTELSKSGWALKKKLRERTKQEVMASAKRIAAMKMGEVLIMEGPKIHEGWKKRQAEKDIEEALAIPQESGEVMGFKEQTYRERMDEPDFPKKEGWQELDLARALNEPREAESHWQGGRTPFTSGDPQSDRSFGVDAYAILNKYRKGGPRKPQELDLFDLSGSPYEREADYYTDEILRRPPPPASQARLR
jgi:hypothetical protein